MKHANDNKALHFSVGRLEEANELVRRWHYSARPPGSIQVVGTFHEDGGLFGDTGVAVAACFFSSPPSRWSEQVLELSRLVRVDTCQISLTPLIAQTCAYIRRNKIANLLVSFADPTAGHHGGIYQAASWKYAGQRNKSCDGLIINGRFTPGRTCNSVYGTRSAKKLKELKPDLAIEEHWDLGKQLYWRALDKHGERKATRLGLQALPYPKPDNDNTTTEKAA